MGSRLKKLLVFTAGAFFLSIIYGATAPSAHAVAPLSYTEDANISLTGPAVTFTIVAGSKADVLTVNATSVEVTLSDTTGGSFSLTSALRDLTIASSSGGGAVATSCTSGVASTTISQSSGSATYTISPAASQCSISSPSPPPASSGGGIHIASVQFLPAVTVANGTALNAVHLPSTVVVTSNYGTTLAAPVSWNGGSPAYDGSVSGIYTFTGVLAPPGWANANNLTASVNVIVSAPAAVSSGGGSGVSVPVATTTATTSAPVSVSGPAQAATTTSTAGLQAQLAALMAQLNALLAQAREQGVSVSTTSAPTGIPPFRFIRNLTVGATGDDVKQLQLFLVVQNSGPAAQKLSRHGATKNFGTLTLNALIEFQKKTGIRPASGYFGPKTRTYVNNLQ